MRSVKSYAARKLNRLIGDKGRLWQPGYHDHALRKDEDLEAAGRYLLANPLRAGLVDDLYDYPQWDALWL